jgi:hypothetical protein
MGTENSPRNWVSSFLKMSDLEQLETITRISEANYKFLSRLMSLSIILSHFGNRPAMGEVSRAPLLVNPTLPMFISTLVFKFSALTPGPISNPEMI